MARKNIFQLVEEHYDIQAEAKKIDFLFKHEEYFSRNYTYYTLQKLIEEYLFVDWRYRGTCIEIKEYLERANANIPSKGYSASEDTIINFLEAMENFVELYERNGNNLFAQYNIKYYGNFYDVFCPLIDTMEKRMGLSRRKYRDRVILYPKNAPLEGVLNVLDEEDVQWELIRYAREDMTLSEKRKSLAYLATNLYIEDDKNETNPTIKTLISKAGNILNNLHIRHNNKTGKWENEALKDVSKKEALMLCDMIFNEMLTIVLLREHKKYEETYIQFNKKQKKVKEQKSGEQ